MGSCSEARRLANMTVRSLKRWRKSEAFRDYRRYRDGQMYSGYTDNVVDRAIRVLKGSARPSSCRKMKSFVKRHKKQSAGKKRFGSGGSKISAQTAALRNWGYDPTGKYND